MKKSLLVSQQSASVDFVISAHRGRITGDRLPDKELGSFKYDFFHTHHMLPRH